MSEWENKKVKVTVDDFEFETHYSRLIASWRNVCKENGAIPYYGDKFKSWLNSIGITDETTIFEIVQQANCGKFELEKNLEKNTEHFLGI